MKGTQSAKLPLFPVESGITVSPTDSVNGMQVDVVHSPLQMGVTHPVCSLNRKHPFVTTIYLFSKGYIGTSEKYLCPT